MLAALATAKPGLPRVTLGELLREAMWCASELRRSLGRPVNLGPRPCRECERTAGQEKGNGPPEIRQADRDVILSGHDRGGIVSRELLLQGRWVGAQSGGMDRFGLGRDGACRGAAEDRPGTAYQGRRPNDP